jgi:hypothetical protein
LPLKVAFYPCCRLDFVRPIELLAPYADEVVFCDKAIRIAAEQQILIAKRANIAPRARVQCGDARDVVKEIECIDVLFYRRDGVGEGGSGLFVLGDSFLPDILAHFPARGGLIITDGSNSRGSNFKRMIRKSGLDKHGWHFEAQAEQPLLTTDGLYCIQLSPAVGKD